MKKIILMLTVLFVSVLTTACINNLAIQELNNKAKAYMDAREVEKAICRYKSSLDLDENIFETNYNLGVAYISEKNYKEAVDFLKNAIKINSTQPDAYYSLGVALESIAYDKIAGVDKDKNNDELVLSESYTQNNLSEEEKMKALTDAEKQEISKLFMDAVDNYNQYLALNPQAEDKEKVSAQVEEINAELLKYTPADSVMAED